MTPLPLYETSLGAIQSLISYTLFTAVVHAFIFCASTTAICCAYLHSVGSELGSQTHSRLSNFSHISIYVTDVLYWLPVVGLSRIKYKVLLLVSRIPYICRNSHPLSLSVSLSISLFLSLSLSLSSLCNSVNFHVSNPVSLDG